MPVFREVRRPRCKLHSCCEIRSKLRCEEGRKEGRKECCSCSQRKKESKKFHFESNLSNPCAPRRQTSHYFTTRASRSQADNTNPQT